jgi:murein L,D-transpeptidase YafK
MKRKITKTFVAFIIIVLMLVVAVAIYYYYPEKKLPAGSIINKIVVEKSKREMSVFGNDKLLKTYKISLGHCPAGNKEYEGDNKTPEGSYIINDKNPNSVCHKNLGISYPNEQDLAEAKKKGKPAGGQIKIHGLLNGKGYIGKFHRWKDWTNGCIGVTDEEIDELYQHTPIGTPIVIKP